MIGETLFLIPVRGGSKGIPDKNLQSVGGMSLLARAVRRALDARRMLGGWGRVIVDTDSERLRQEALRYGAEVPFLRPPSLAGDEVGSLDVIRHALGRLGVGEDDPRAVVLLQATSPFCPPEHVREALMRFRERDGAPVVSVAAWEHPVAWCFSMDDRGRLHAGAEDVPARRQDSARHVRPTGAVYVASARELLRGLGFVQSGRTVGVMLPRTQALDVDEPDDLAMARAWSAWRRSEGVRIGDRVLGETSPCFVIAEAGVNHDGDVGAAHALVDAAAEAGADAVKFQTWRTELVCRPGMRTADYQRANAGAVDQYEMLRGLELPWSAHAALRDHARERGIEFLSTPDEVDSARMLVELGVPAIKVGSGDLDNHLLLSQLAEMGRPLLLSTGMADVAEVAEALGVVRAHGDPPVALFHAVSAYPAPVESMNVRAIATLREAFGCPVGLSDHSVGPEAMLASVGVGLALWEKHLTLDRARPGPDHAASLDVAQFAAQVRMLRDAERALGDGAKRMRSVEAPTRPVVRKRLFARVDLTAGVALAPGDVMALRADEGLPVSRWTSVRGRLLRQDLRAGSPIEEAHLG